MAVGAILSHLCLGETLGSSGADALLVEVRRSAQHKHAVDVDLVRACKPRKGLHGAVSSMPQMA